MHIELKKFGTILTSRQAGKEAFAAFKPTLTEIKKGEVVEVDFDGISTFSPSWGDEFLRPLHALFTDHLFLKTTTNLSVLMTLELLEETLHITFQKKK